MTNVRRVAWTTSKTAQFGRLVTVFALTKLHSYFYHVADFGTVLTKPCGWITHSVGPLAWFPWMVGTRAPGGDGGEICFKSPRSVQIATASLTA